MLYRIHRLINLIHSILQENRCHFHMYRSYHIDKQMFKNLIHSFWLVQGRKKVMMHTCKYWGAWFDTAEPRNPCRNSRRSSHAFPGMTHGLYSTYVKQGKTVSMYRYTYITRSLDDVWHVIENLERPAWIVPCTRLWHILTLYRVYMCTYI